MRGPEALLEREDNWTTAMGACFPGEDRVAYRGKDVFQDMARMPWMAVLLYGITGREFTAGQLKLFEGIWTICASYPDPRLWNNRVAALAGTARSTAAAAIGAANAVSEATLYGRRPDIRSIDLLLRARQWLSEGRDLDSFIRPELAKHRVLPGYGRPISKRDERIQPMLSLAQELGLASGEHVRLAFAIAEHLQKGRWRLHMNIAALAAALAADLGLSRTEYYHFLVLSFSAGMFPCYLDAMNQPAGTLFPLRCARINYLGQPSRQWS
jgi:citrate synthase